MTILQGLARTGSLVEYSSSYPQVYISPLPTSTCSPRPTLFSLDITLHSRIYSKPQQALQRSDLSGCTMRSSGRVCVTLTTFEVNSLTRQAPRATRNRLSLHFGCLPVQ
jgi:hypothetical protein